MRQAGPHHTHSSDFIIWTWTLPQVPKCSCPSAARRYGGVILTFPEASKTLMQRNSLERECKVTTVNLGFLKRERTLRPRPYLRRACR